MLSRFSRINLEGEVIIDSAEYIWYNNVPGRYIIFDSIIISISAHVSI